MAKEESTRSPRRRLVQFLHLARSPQSEGKSSATHAFVRSRGPLMDVREIEVAPLTSSDVKLDCARMVTVTWMELQNDAVHMRGRRHGSVGQPRSAERRAERAAGGIQEQRRGDEGRIG